MRKLSVFILILVLLTSLATAATLKGSVYNSNLDLEQDVLVEIDTQPTQKYLAKEGTYSFELSQGEYILKATKGFFSAQESISISKEGNFVYDLFLLEDFFDEEELWKSTEEDLFSAVEDETENNWLAYILTGIILVILIFRVIRARKKYGKLSIFRRKVKEEHKKTLAQHQEEIAAEPGYLERTIKIIQKHGGRIHQKTLRKEMLDLSEAKVSLIITELEHKGKVEKIKKGRGNVIILK